MKIRVKNFQAIADAELVIEGFTVITGKTNLGKTALIRALNAMFFGLPGDYYVREGENSAGVVYEDVKDRIVWMKVKKPTPGKVTALQVNGALHTKLGKDGHVPLVAPLGIKEIKTTAATFYPQFAMQHDQIFLLTENEATVAEVFKMLGRIDVITNAQQMVRHDLLLDTQKHRIRQTDRDSAKEAFDQTDYTANLRLSYDRTLVTVKELDQATTKKTATIGEIQRFKALVPRAIPELVEFAPQEKLRRLSMVRRLKTLDPRPIPDAPEVSFPRPTFDKIQLLNKMKVVDTELAKATLDGKQLDNHIERMQEEKLRMEQDLGVCPTCGQSFQHHEEGHGTEIRPN